MRQVSTQVFRLPVWLQDYATRQNVPQTMEHVRRWVDSGGTYRP